MSIKVESANVSINDEYLKAERERAAHAYKDLQTGDIHMTGWVSLPDEISDEKLDAINAAADRIKADSDYLIVVGIGGSFLGACSVIDMLDKGRGVKVLFAGHGFDPVELDETLKEAEGGDYSCCVISKSGGTAEIISTFGIVRERMLERYGREETAKRTYVITGADGYLSDLAKAEGMITFGIPDDIGGRYSVFTDGGLLPIAAAGIDIKALIGGAKKARKEDFDAEDSFDYAIMRQLLNEGTASQDGTEKTAEIYEFYDRKLVMFGEWLKQLFGESEGKEGKGIIPMSLLFSRDLHSMGQFLQQGSPIFYETMIRQEEDPEADFTVPDFVPQPFAGMKLSRIERSMETGVTNAHVSAGTPVITIYFNKLDEDSVGEMLYWFKVQCAVSVLLLGVDPFNQPGVEAYKSEMRKAL
ncbi:MAG: glucose-6-phosphate isomerase [Eubacterium sp.]|nr:glucose-6-phosphate isomerase [Eubacterium sp.]